MRVYRDIITFFTTFSEVVEAEASWLDAAAAPLFSSCIWGVESSLPGGVESCGATLRHFVGLMLKIPRKRKIKFG